MLKVLSLLLIYGIALTSTARVARIRHGRPVTKDEVKKDFPFVVSVLSCGSDVVCVPCTGTLIADSRVLLAANCLCGDNLRTMVYLRSTEAESGKGVNALSSRKNPMYKCDAYNAYQADYDIAVLQLSKSVNAPSVRLDCEDKPPGTEVTMIGYGLDENYDTGILRVAKTSTIQCDDEFTDAYCIDGTDENKVSTDTGDAGGPLLVQKKGGYEQIGVNHGPMSPQGQEDITTILWGKVGPHCDWIRK